MVEELSELMKKFNYLRREYSKDTPSLTYVNEFSTRKDEEYVDILHKKHTFICKLIDATLACSRNMSIIGKILVLITLENKQRVIYFGSTITV